jgi:cell division protein FtsI/penicillin-binding protein 2
VNGGVTALRTRSIWRFSVSLALMTAGLGGILARLVFVQGVHAATYEADARSEYVHEFSFLGERGAILDRNGDELAMSVPMTTIFADPYQVTNPGQEAKPLAVALGLPVATLQAEMSEPSGFVYLARTIADATAAKVERLINQGVVPVCTQCKSPSASTRRDNWPLLLSGSWVPGAPASQGSSTSTTASSKENQGSS